MRNLFLQENNFQLRDTASHERGWSDSYVVSNGHEKIVYGSIKGNEKLSERDTVFEFYIIPAFRNRIFVVFSEVLRISHATFIETQSNDLSLTVCNFNMWKIYMLILPVRRRDKNIPAAL